MKFLDKFKRKKSAFNIDENEKIVFENLVNFLNIRDYDKNRLSEATYFACLKILSESVGKLPINLQKVDRQNGIVNLVNHQLYQVLKNRPNPYMTATTFWTAVENNRNHYGNAYVYIERTKYKTQLWILDPVRVRIEIDELKDLNEQNNIYYIYTSQNGKQLRLPSMDILHLKTSTTFGGLVGISVREKLKMSLDSAEKSQQMLNKLYENNFIAKAAVQYPGEINDELEKKYIKALDDYALGKKETKSFIPLPLGSSIVPLNIKLTDGQFLELRKYTALQIASAFGIKPNQLNDYEKASYSNSEAQQLAFYAETMLYIIKQYEEELNFKLLSEKERKNGLRFKFNVASVLRGDTKSQVESLTKGIANALYSPNEARYNLDLPSRKGGDRLYFNGSNIPIELAGIQYGNKVVEGVI